MTTTILTELDDETVLLTLVQGDSADLVLTVDDGAFPTAALIDLSKAVDGTVAFHAVVRMAIKDAPADEDNTLALAYRASFDATQVTIPTQTGAALGTCTVHLDKPDTEAADPALSYQWDVEVTRQGDVRTSAGTAVMLAGGGAVVGSGTAFLSARVGDVFQAGAGANSGLPCLITAIADDTHMTVENPKLAADATGRAFTIRRGVSRTVVRGACTILQGVVKA